MIVKRLYLNMENWSINRGSYQLGYIAENTVTLLQIATDIDTDCTYHLEQEIDGESYILYLEQGDGVLTATIPNTMLTKVGNANWQIVGIWSDESVKKSNVFNVYISDAINAENEVPASEITAFTEALADLAENMSEVAEYAESASASASEAATSATEAATSATSASESAEGASASATNASTSASEAATSASEASASATEASTYATNASTSASEASTYATSASTSATEASGYAELASASASSASTSASETSTHAANASTSASEASTSASSASASATSASESASEASTYATNAETSATSASTSATSAQTYASNASTSEQNCATYASNARASAAEAQGYVESLDNWTTVEFDLDDFTYDEDSGVTYLPIEAPDGYLLEEIRGCIILNCTETSSDSAILSIEPVAQSNNAIVPVMYRTPFGISGANGNIGTILYPTLKYNTDLAYVTGIGSYYTNASNAVNSNSAGTNSLIRTRPGLNTSGYSQSRIVLKTNVPNSNISEFYGKLQYRVKSTT